MNNYFDHTKNKIEIYIGGAIAVIAIVAIIANMMLKGINTETMLETIINISGVLVSAIVMFIAIRTIVTNRPKNLKEELVYGLDKWEKSNHPLIFKVTDFETPQGKKNYKMGYSILAKHTDYLILGATLTDEEKEKYSTRNSKKSGKFISMPDYENMINGNPFFIEFNLIDSTYVDVDTKKVVEDTINCIGKRNYQKYALDNRTGKEFTYKCQPITTKEDVADFISFLNFVLTLMLIQS